MPQVDVLILTCNRPAALAVTLASLIGQRFDDFRVVILDQSDGIPSFDAPESQAVIRVMRAQGREVEAGCNLPRGGLAQQRQALLERANSPYVLFLDDDVILEPDALARMVEALSATSCGFVGSAVIGLSYLDDVRPHQQHVEFWDRNVVEPEVVGPDTSAWSRHALHNAANLWHVQHSLAPPAGTWRAYKLAWVGGCGIIPSGAFHQELPTTVPNRQVDLPHWKGAEPGNMAATQ